MTPHPAPPDGTRIELSRQEAWMLHHVMLERLQDAERDCDPKPWWAIRVLETLEADERTVTTFEAWRVRRDLREYRDASGTPDEEAAVATAVLEELDERVEPPPKSLRAT